MICLTYRRNAFNPFNNFYQLELSYTEVQNHSATVESDQQNDFLGN